MRKLKLLLMVALLIVAGSVAIGAESASALLEKGIYTEETVGDLPKAIEIYQQVVTEAKTTEAAAAEAQYRLGQCLLKQNKKDEAVAAFQKVIDSYPGQKDWIAKAKKLLPGQAELKLEAVPWKDGEFMQSVVTIGGGMKIGAFVWSLESVKVGGKDVWRMKKHQYIMSGGDNRGFSQVDADKASFEPIKSIFRHTLLGNIEADYTPGNVTVTVFKDGKQASSRKDTLDKVYYDNEQAYHVFQRLPLKEGYKANVPIYSPVGAGKIELPVEVTVKETIEVPAGKFECFKLHLGIVNQTFWMSSDEHRYIVKFEAGGVVSELDQVGVNKLGEMKMYKNDEWGFSFSTPAGWYLYDGDKSDKNDYKAVFLLDPNEDGTGAVTVYKNEGQETDAKNSPRAWAESVIDTIAKSAKGYKIRPDSWRELTIGGLPAVSVIGDYTVNNEKKVDYNVFVVGKTTKAKLRLNMIDPDKFEGLCGEFDKIGETLKIK